MWQIKHMCRPARPTDHSLVLESIDTHHSRGRKIVRNYVSGDSIANGLPNKDRIINARMGEEPRLWHDAKRKKFFVDFYLIVVDRFIRAISSSVV